MANAFFTFVLVQDGVLSVGLSIVETFTFGSWDAGAKVVHNHVSSTVTSGNAFFSAFFTSSTQCITTSLARTCTFLVHLVSGALCSTFTNNSCVFPVNHNTMVSTGFCVGRDGIAHHFQRVFHAAYIPSARGNVILWHNNVVAFGEGSFVKLVAMRICKRGSLLLLIAWMRPGFDVGTILISFPTVSKIVG